MNPTQSHKPPARAQEDRGALQVPAVDEFIQSATIGETGRVWALPFQCLTVSYSPIPIFVGSTEMNTAANTREFLTRHTPEELSNLSRAVERLRRTPQGEWLTVTHKMLLDPESCANMVTYVEREPRSSDAPRPSQVTTPTITSDHWYYRRHYNPGSYTAPTKHPETSSVNEVTQDISSLIHYMSAYDTLAREPSGENLFAATLDAQYRAPYYSCMQLCGELGIPGHFLAMVHHGIGLQMLIGQPFNSSHWDSRTEEERNLRHTAARLFDRIVVLYLEDFPGVGD